MLDSLRTNLTAGCAVAALALLAAAGPATPAASAKRVASGQLRQHAGAAPTSPGRSRPQHGRRRHRGAARMTSVRPTGGLRGGSPAGGRGAGTGPGSGLAAPSGAGTHPGTGTSAPSAATPPPGTTPASAPGTPPLAPPLGDLAVITPFPATPRIFAPASIWNQPLADDAPLDPGSAGLTAALAGEVRREVGANTGPWINTTKYSVPVYTVGPGVPKVYVTLDNVKPVLQSELAAVPVPEQAHASADTDALLVIYQPATDTLWELFRARKAADGWHARYGGRIERVSSSPGYFPDKLGASASSLALLGGLMTIQELKAGNIDHALSMAVPTTAIGRFVWPAQRSDGRSSAPDAIPEGTRFRIDPAVDLSTLGLTPAGMAIARAAQRYGIIVRDGANNVTLYGEDPTTSGGNPYAQIFGGRYPNGVLQNFPWDRLQVVAPAGA